ncbi:MAG: hypothetical protein HGB02_08075 [Chlorobiaceae bacterium]|nr:hypothetical protein [Chlorobiaceae bacterium]
MIDEVTGKEKAAPLSSGFFVGFYGERLQESGFRRLASLEAEVPSGTIRTMLAAE